MKARDPESTLSEMEDMAFLSDLGLIKYDAGNLKLTIAGLLFVGKEQAIHRLISQAEVIYLHFYNIYFYLIIFNLDKVRLSL